MQLSIIQIWFIAGLALALAEAVVPGLVAIFIGMGAATVALLLYSQVISSPIEQALCFFLSTSIYLFTLRLLVMQYYPSDTKKQNIDEIENVVGQIVAVIERIPAGGVGRIQYGDSTWPAKLTSNTTLDVGSTARIVNRENITWIVEEIES